jgi:hypothetical protein
VKTLVDEVHTSSIKHEEISYLWKRQLYGRSDSVGYDASKVKRTLIQ